MTIPIHCLRFLLTGPRRTSFICTRSSTTTTPTVKDEAAPDGDKNSSGKKTDLTAPSEKSLATKSSIADALAKFEIPDDNPEKPKKHVFQQIRQIRQSGAIFSLEEGAQHTPSQFIYRSFKYPKISEQVGMYEYANRSHENEHTTVYQFPDLSDFIIVGSGLVGSATAYYTKRLCSRVGDVVVLDKAPYSPHNCTSICNGLISAQSKNGDISRMAILTKELIRNLRQDVLVTPEDLAQICYRPVTHLVLWREGDVDAVVESVDRQIGDGIYTEGKLPDELEQTWPWLSVKNTDVHIGTHGNQDEALVDPIGLRNLYRTLAQAHGAHFIEAEALDFNMQYNINMPMMHALSAGGIVARVTSGELRSVLFAKTLLSLGHNMPFFESRADMDVEIRDSIQDLHFIQPKLRLCFVFSSEAAPVINFPVITDTDGCMLIRDDYAGTFKFYLTLKESDMFFEEDNEKFLDLETDEPFVTLLHRDDESFETYFNNVIKPRLVKRIPVMEDAKLLLTNSGFESYNTYDANPVASLHPFHAKILMSGGFGKRLMNFGPACAASLAELLVLDEERTFDVTNFYWDRVMKGNKIDEFPSLVA